MSDYTDRAPDGTYLREERVCDRCDGEGTIEVGGYSVSPFSGVLVPDPQVTQDGPCPDCDGTGWAA